MWNWLFQLIAQGSRRRATTASWLRATWRHLLKRKRSHGLKGEPDLNAALRMPGALQAENRAEIDLTALEASVRQEVGPLLEELKVMRAREGESLEAILRGTLDRLADSTDYVAQLAARRSNSVTRSA